MEASPETHDSSVAPTARIPGLIQTGYFLSLQTMTLLWILNQLSIQYQEVYGSHIPKMVPFAIVMSIHLQCNPSSIIQIALKDKLILAKQYYSKKLEMLKGLRLRLYMVFRVMESLWISMKRLGAHSSTT